MAYRSRKQDRDQALMRRIADSWKYAKRPTMSPPDPEIAEIMRKHPGMTKEAAIDEEIRLQLADLAAQ
jgi:hypothetical protein